MTDPQNTTPPMPRQTDKWLEPGPQNALLIYILYLAGFVFGGFPTIVGIVMAYLNRNKAGGFVETHYTWLIRTFWISLAYAAISIVLFFIGIGFLLLFAVAVWAVIRLVKGLMALNRNEPMPDPATWWI
ncbi:DUF4870 family protein [Oricola thermophila]|uniref:DUF4870 domain-containing protein n=1 Tax=Oricola thermophila TaxID=2742145 RepID=A0A6N1VFA3_9HYPH|nr:DUF4870 domain-containing protein [Oricola thermophila]QKV19243.1 hypothetical protein HTY61_12640 [Oricola thermophila]